MLGLVLVENKTNEIKAIKSVTGITGGAFIDAMGTQTEIARRLWPKAQITFCVSKNHPSLCARVKAVNSENYVRYYSRNSVF